MALFDEMKARIGSTCRQRRPGEREPEERKIVGVVALKNLLGEEQFFFEFARGDLAGPGECWFELERYPALDLPGPAADNASWNFPR